MFLDAAIPRAHVTDRPPEDQGAAACLGEGPFVSTLPDPASSASIIVRTRIVRADEVADVGDAKPATPVIGASTFV
jgi:hypothetical protein